MGVLPTFVFPLLAYTWEISLGSEQKKKIKIKKISRPQPHIEVSCSPPHMRKSRAEQTKARHGDLLQSQALAQEPQVLHLTFLIPHQVDFHHTHN